MRTTRLSSLHLPLCTAMVATAIAMSSAPVLAQQAQPAPVRPAQTTTPPAEMPPPSPSAMTYSGSRHATLPQGFSVVLVLGDIQGTATADDVPPAARKALVDMREFLPFKSYKLLDAAWVMCCGQQGSNALTDRRPAAQAGWNASTQTLSQVLRGPEEQEYELKLMTSRAEGGQVFVRFSLFGSGAPRDAVVDAASASATSRTSARRIADLKDQRALLDKQIQDMKKRAELGGATATDVAKLEVEARQMDREIADLSARAAEGSAGRSAARAGVELLPRSAIIDTSFTMNVGETVVVGTSRLKGGTRALIALLTAVPTRGANERRE